MKSLKGRAVPFRSLELIHDNWAKEFGEGRTVKTPIGDVKIGDNQYFKLKARSREKYFGLIKPTLTDPLYVIEIHDPQEGVERDTKLMYANCLMKKLNERERLPQIRNKTKIDS